ncbi:MAG: AAA family ATPase [Deltaproteobacteria bacterium]|nr:AAA family ATPase [Deltaproteobacteria bacterium]
MNYYDILNLKKEPFSNSPEPEFLFQLPQHTDCLQRLELAVRLRRGINVVIGDIGTGKTTLCRKLIQNLSSAPEDSTEIETYLLLDPAFNNAVEFLQTVALMLGIKDLNNCESEWHLKERIKTYLFSKGVDEKRIVVLIIDEGQKIPENCLEILREFLNYETNNFKLLQIIIFAQKEFQKILKKRANLFDRVNLLYQLYPLNFRQTQAMINYRLSVARDFEIKPSLFSFGGLAAVYQATGGYPRKIIFLCHQIILKMIIRSKKKAGWFLVRSCVNEMTTPLLKKLRLALESVLIIIALGLSISTILFQYRDADAHKQTPAVSIVPEVKQAPPVSIAPDSIIIQKDEKHDVKIPDYIGRLTMPQKRTIWWTLYNIYGETSSDIMDSVITANPHIKNRNIIAEGTIVALPSIPADIKPVNKDDIVVVVESGKDLEKMYNIFRNNPDEKKMPPLVFFSFWNKKEGIEFAIVIDKCFQNISAAEEAIGKLPPVIAAKTKILSQWDADTVFFNRRALQH